MRFEKKFNNYTIHEREVISLKNIDAFLIDIKRRKLLKVSVPNSVEFFIKKNNFHLYECLKIENFRHQIKQIAIYSIDEDIKKKNIPYKLNGVEVHSDCLICSYVKDEYDLRKSKLTEQEITEMINF